MVEDINPSPNYSPILIPGKATKNGGHAGMICAPWPKGYCPNPGGKAKRWSARRELRNILERTEDGEQINNGTAILNVVASKAKDGDLKAAEVILDRVYPKPKQDATVSVTHVTIESNTYIDRVRANSLAQLKELADANGNGH